MSGLYTFVHGRFLEVLIIKQLQKGLLPNVATDWPANAADVSGKPDGARNGWLPESANAESSKAGGRQGPGDLRRPRHMRGRTRSEAEPRNGRASEAREAGPAVRLLPARETGLATCAALGT
jgi:hypothetical protein